MITFVSLCHHPMQLMKKSPIRFNLSAETVRCLFNRPYGCSALCSGHSGGGREVVVGKTGPGWLGLAERSDITWRRSPVV